ncbi:MAG: phosphoethanolamine--lipid A transferase [Sulfurospirillaceae bacterium]|nr:phosphoethanolamine--lipid A transferase [Sulfurospirillaceae bacterium]
MALKTTSKRLILYVSLFLVLVDNYTFFKNVLSVYPLSWQNSGFIFSLGVVLTSILILLLNLLTSRYSLKIFLITLVLLSAITNYFMNTYHVIIDDTMIQNIAETNVGESWDLLSLKLLVYIVFLGLLPSWIIYKTEVYYAHYTKELFATLKMIIFVISVSLALMFAFSKFYTSFFRENKTLRFYSNPTYPIYSAGKYLYNSFSQRSLIVKTIGLDAQQKPSQHRRMTIVVVGEAARANRFSLNGYERETNPLLKKEDIINLDNVSSCGTSTAISVPCMFSILDRVQYSDKEAKSTENVLDVLKHSGVSVLWRDNNSDSKGVALRVSYEDFRTAKTNTLCDVECRDEGMLIGLKEYISEQKGDILIVLHQMGNHGPAYYKRYPKSFEKFTPACQTNQVEQCSSEEIGNAYDNAILYTDYFLSKTINFLKQYDDIYQTALIYMADHGESLGENGLYLHGIPYFMAPEEQTHIGAFVWIGKMNRDSIDVEALRQKANEHYSQDNLFHTILGLMGTQTAVYEKRKDILIYK